MEGAGYSTYEFRVRAVEAVHNGIPIVDVAQAYRVDRTTVHRWLTRYDRGEGESGLRRRPVSGRPRKLADWTEGDWWRIVLKPASTFGYETDFWTVRRLHQVIRERYNADVSADTIWRRLREARLTYQKPERQYFQLDERKREEWIRDVLPEIRQTVEKYRAILYFEDEANVSLTPFLGKTWAPRGETPKARVTGTRGGVAAMSAITQRGHLLFTLHQKRIASDEVIHFLGQMLEHHKRRHLVVAMDKAPPHTSKKTWAYINSQPRLHVFHLPSYSPDWNPDEKVWNHLKHQELKSHQAKTADELHVLAQSKLTSMSEDPELLRGIFFRCCVAELLR
jgi:transposase